MPESAQKEAVVWAQGYNSCTLKNDDVIIYSSESEFFFGGKDYPLFNFIGSGLSRHDIAGQAKNSMQGSLFLYISSSFIKEGIISDKTDDSSLETISCLQEIKKNLENNSRTEYIIVDFFSLDINKLNGIQQFSLIGIVKGRIIISPIFFKNSGNIVQGFLESIRKNNPVRFYVANNYPEQYYEPKVRSEFNQCFLDVFDTEIANRIIDIQNYRRPTAISFSRDKDIQEHVFFYMDISTKEYSEKLGGPINLKSCFINHDKDGGSRNISPSDTLNNIKSLVDPFFGIVNDMRDISDDNQGRVKIYRSAFYKKAYREKNISTDSFIQSCLGKGAEKEQSQVSAICEAIERYSANYYGYEELLRGKASELDNRHLKFQDINPYSDTQYNNFSNPDHPDSLIKQSVARYNDESIYWAKVWSLTYSEKVYIPLTLCFSNIPYDDVNFGKWNSNGASAGNTVEEAILQGIFELIERDAAAIWWYNKQRYPEFSLDLLNMDYLGPIKEYLEGQYNYWILDLTIDTAIPVMVAIAKDKISGRFILGFGCHIKPELAAQRAITELCQLIPIRNQPGAPFNFDDIPDEEYLYPSPEARKAYLSDNNINDIKELIELIVDHLDKLGMEVLGLNYNRSYPIETVKIFIPGLCHIWPQFANNRLYNTLFNMGIMPSILSEDELNPLDLYI